MKNILKTLKKIILIVELLPKIKKKKKKKRGTKYEENGPYCEEKY